MDIIKYIPKDKGLFLVIIKLINKLARERN